jgi:hypothetical protein
VPVRSVAAAILPPGVGSRGTVGRGCRAVTRLRTFLDAPVKTCMAMAKPRKLSGPPDSERQQLCSGTHACFALAQTNHFVFEARSNVVTQSRNCLVVMPKTVIAYIPEAGPLGPHVDTIDRKQPNSCCMQYAGSYPAVRGLSPVNIARRLIYRNGFAEKAIYAGPGLQ